MAWGFIAFILLLYNIFDIDSDGSMMGLGPSGFGSANQNTYANLMGALAEKEYGIEKNKLRHGGGIFDPLNLIYLLVVLGNVIGFIILQY